VHHGSPSCVARTTARQPSARPSDGSRTSRTLPTSLLNSVRSSSAPFRSESLGAAVAAGGDEGMYPPNRSNTPRATATTARASSLQPVLFYRLQ
jgi:hypothetical protein